MKQNKITVSKIISSSFLFLSITFVLSFLIRHSTLDDLIAGMHLPWPHILWILPVVFLIEAVPSWFLSNKFSTMVKDEQEVDNQLSKSFSIAQLAIMYLFSTTSEELLFRFTIQNWIMQYAGLPLAVIITSTLWFFAHKRFRGYWQLYLLMLWISIVYGVLYAATGSWLLVSISHFLHNFLLGAAGIIKDKKNNEISGK